MIAVRARVARRSSAKVPNVIHNSGLLGKTTIASQTLESLGAGVVTIAVSSGYGIVFPVHRLVVPFVRSAR